MVILLRGLRGFVRMVTNVNHHQVVQDWLVTVHGEVYPIHLCVSFTWSGCWLSSVNKTDCHDNGIIDLM